MVAVERTRDARLVFEVEQAAGNKRGLHEVARRVDMSDTFVAREDATGRAVGVGSLQVYGRGDEPALAWIGGMSVRPDARRQGAARAILLAMLSRAEALAVPVVGLDASEMGRPLYEQHGFVARCRTSRWRRAEARASFEPSPRHAVHPVSVSEAMEIAAFDAARFGANRMPWLLALLRDFPFQSFMTRDRATGEVSGFAFGNERAIGPLVADDDEAAAALLWACESAGAVRNALVEDPHAGATRVLREAGYEPDGGFCTRMTLRGEPLPGKRDAVYAAATWAMG